MGYDEEEGDFEEGEIQGEEKGVIDEISNRYVEDFLDGRNFPLLEPIFEESISFDPILGSPSIPREQKASREELGGPQKFLGSECGRGIRID